VAADQLPNGSVPFVIPDVLSTPQQPAAGSAGWADAAVIIPWTLYRVYGDTCVLEQQYPSMVKWVEYMRGRAGDDHIWSGDFHFGDWLAYATTRSDYPGATTGKDLIATAFYAHSTDLLARIARVLGRTDDSAKYSQLVEAIRAAWVREYVSPNGRVGEDTQTAYVLAMQFDLLPPERRGRAMERLASEVEQRKHLTTGFLGTPYLLHVLSKYGYEDDAYMLMERTEYPSWLYPVTKGATTIWERWDGIKADGSFQDAGMNSFNHYAYGAVGEWMYTTMAGLAIDEQVPGYKHVIIAPRPGGTIASARARHLSMYGPVSSEWEGKGDRFVLSVEVPANTTATVVPPPRAVVTGATESGRPLQQAEGVLSVTTGEGGTRIEIGSGTYRFEFAWR
jgi:alpha-L-rhamnosidase